MMKAIDGITRLLLEDLESFQRANYEKELEEFFEAKMEMRKSLEYPKNYLVIWHSVKDTGIWNYFRFVGKLPEEHARLTMSPALLLSIEKGVFPKDLHVDVYELASDEIWKPKFEAGLRLK